MYRKSYVSGWDDPRMPTICGLRRRGYTPEAIRNFADLIGVAKRDNVIDIGLLEYCISEDLNKKACRVMGVLNPLKIIIDNYPDDQVEEMEAVNNPEDHRQAAERFRFHKVFILSRKILWKIRSGKFFRLAPEREVRLRSAYIIKCEDGYKKIR